MSAELETLKAQGRYAEAAAQLCSLGREAEGAKLLADVWDFAGALRIARDAGLLADAYRYALEAQDSEACSALCAALQHEVDEKTLRTLAALAERRGRFEDAAYFLLWLEEPAHAAACFAEAGRPLVAARLLVTRGRAREAAELLARAYATDGDPEVAVGLAQSLLALGRPNKALEIIQQANVPDALIGKQQRLIAQGLHALGMHDAARGIEARLLGSRASTLHGIRYLAVGASRQTFDRWLRRACDESFDVGVSRSLQLRAYASVVHPHVQQVLALRDGHAILESPTGIRLSRCAPGDHALGRADVFSQLDSALRALARANVAHGAVDEDHICIDTYRAVLLIPASPMPSASIEADRVALRALRQAALVTAA